MAESKRIGDRAYVAVGGSYDSYVITKHLGGPFYEAELEFGDGKIYTLLITGKHVTDSIEAVEPWSATILWEDNGLAGMYHAGGTVHVWVEIVAMSAGQALIRGDVLEGGQRVVPSKEVSLA